jgi:hypothetical protein
MDEGSTRIDDYLLQHRPRLPAVLPWFHRRWHIMSHVISQLTKMA